MEGLVVAAVSGEPAPAAVGQTRVARWQDDEAACFLPLFDNSLPSHWQASAPELVERGMVAMFYVCPDKGEYRTVEDHWERELWKQGMAYGDHTMTHQGVTDLGEAEREIGGCRSRSTQ